MSIDAKNYLTQYGRHKEALIYDAQSVVLAGKYSDELSAYRARKLWKTVLNAHFLLEEKRDYQLFITGTATAGHYVVICNFLSACGRYAFWRLVNQQAPEAEAKLSASSRGDFSIKRLFTREANHEALLRQVDQQIVRNTEIKGLLGRLRQLFS